MVVEVGEQDVVHLLFPHLYDNDQCTRLIASCFRRFLVRTLFQQGTVPLLYPEDLLTKTVCEVHKSHLDSGASL